MTDPSRPYKVRRAGFTLIELLVVILILAILVALLVPAIAAAVRAANDARVSAEINNLATALADFKNTYGDYPPSRILLPTANTNGGLTTIISSNLSGVPVYNPGGLADITVRDLASRTQRAMLKMFPRANGPASLNVPGAGAYVILQGHECLVFFLGGMPLYDGTTDTYSMKGFSKDPTLPFSTVGTNRTRPFYEFPSNRLQDLYSTPITAGASVFNDFPSFMDPLSSSRSESRPYTYFSAYGNNNYDPNDDNCMGIGLYERGATAPTAESIEQDDSQTGGGIFRAFRVNFPPATEVSYGPNPYTSTDPTAATSTYVNPQSFQIISAGRDRQFGVGGAYTPNATQNKLPINPNNFVIPGNSGSGSESVLEPLRMRERDNITNFAQGKLD